MRALLALLLLAPTAAAHPDAADHGTVFVSAWGDGMPTRLVEGCAFYVEAALEDGWTSGRLVLLESDEAGALAVAAETEWETANGSLLVGPLDVGPGVYVAGVELDAEHGAYGPAFRVQCGDPVCPRDGCATLRVSSAGEGTRPVKLALGLALAGVVAAAVLVVRRG